MAGKLVLLKQILGRETVKVRERVVSKTVHLCKKTAERAQRKSENSDVPWRVRVRRREWKEL